MSFVKRFFSVSKILKDYCENKAVQKSFFFVLSFFLILGFFASSHTVVGYDTIGMYNDCDELSSATTGVDGKHSQKSQCFQVIDFTTSSLDFLNPTASTNAQAVIENPNLSEGTKMGFVGVMSYQVNALLYNPPRINIPEHLAQEWIPNYAPTTSVYASGYQQLDNSGITELWTSVRNVAYIFFVVVFIIGGFMIMFRHKLGGQTMVTLYNTLPNIIVGLVLVTFSFAIVGFIIDIGAMLIRVASGFLNPNPPLDATSPFGIAEYYAKGMIDDALEHIVGEHITRLIQLLEQLFGKIFTGIWELILYIVILYISIKIFFTLIRAYIGILFDTIASPIVLAIATIPGKSAVMKDWFYRITKNTLVFVLVFILIHLPQYFSGQTFNVFGGDLGSNAMNASPVNAIVMVGVSLYLLFLAANVPKLLDEYFPQTGGKGSASMAEGAKRDASKIPLIGGFFKS